MQNRQTLQRTAQTLNYNLGQTEKDYLQHLILGQLAKHMGTELVFKGGTCLQKTMGLPRFSEDLDFTRNKPLQLQQTIEAVVRDLGFFGYESRQKTAKKKDAVTTKLLVKGPLHEGTDLSACSITIEVSNREKIILEPSTVSITPIYNDISPYLTISMNPREILAEKVRAILTRQKARDVYDLHFLLRKNTPIDTGLIGEKLHYYRREFTAEEFTEKIHDIEALWNPELRGLTKHILPYAEVQKDIVERFTTIQ